VENYNNKSNGDNIAAKEPEDSYTLKIFSYLQNVEIDGTHRNYWSLKSKGQLVILIFN